MIHLILVFIVLLLFFVFSIILLPAEWIIGKFSPDARAKSSLAIVQFVLKLLMLAAGTKVTVIGEENVPKDQAVLYIGNHRSYFDVVVTYARCPRPTGYIAKKEMGKVPLLSNWMKNLHCLFLDRKDIKQGLKTILEAIEMVKSGISICIFPEGTRSKGPDELELLPFHEGSFKIATKSGCPIVPMALTHTAGIYEAHKPWIQPQHVTLEFLPPIETGNLDRASQRGLGARTQELVAAAVRKNQ